MSYLSKELLKKLYSVSGRSRTRIDVVSEKLCDDVIQRLTPSLSQFRGCTIIDCLPGVGLFSRKLHDVLKPRRHILIEPQWEQYSPFLKPLLEASDSPFQHRNWKADKPFILESFIEDGLIPRYIEPDHSILHLVNATSSLIATGNKQARFIDGRAFRFARAIRNQNGFASRGPYRMLAWCEDEQKVSCLPRNIDNRRKQAFLLESHCRVEEVAGHGRPTERGGQRQSSYDIQSSQAVAERMKKNNIVTPVGREEQKSEGLANTLGEIPRYWHAELVDLERGFAEGKYHQYVGERSSPVVEKTRGRPWPPAERAVTSEYKRLRMLQRTLRAKNKNHARLKVFADEQAAIDALDLQSYSPDLSTNARLEIIEDIDRRADGLRQRISKLSAGYRSEANILIDDHFAFNMAPGPLLMWDQRSYEPLKADPSEFFPNKKIALLDFQAKPPGTLPLTDEQGTYFDYIAGEVFVSKGYHNLHVLDHLAPRAADDLIPKVPELKDAREGGRRHVDLLHARTITPKMLWKLALAWDKWPFKPDRSDMVVLHRGADLGKIGRQVIGRPHTIA